MEDFVAETRTSRSFVSREGQGEVERIAKPPKKPWWMRWKVRIRERARAASERSVWCMMGLCMQCKCSMIAFFFDTGKNFWCGYSFDI